MSLSVGTDSYVTVTEANELIAAYSFSSDATLNSWSRASDSDKEVALRKSCIAIDKLKWFKGARKTTKQKLEFPRVKSIIGGIYAIPFVPQGFDNWLDESATSDDGLKDVKLAQSINAAYCLYMNGDRLSQMSRNVTGLIAEKVGPTMESYVKPESNTYNTDLMIGIYTKEVYHILAPWLSGTYYGF